MAGPFALIGGNRDFRLLLSAGLVSLVGDWILRAGLSYLVYDLTGSPAASAATLLAALAPQLVFGSVAGVVADRRDRLRTMVVTNLLLAATLLPLLAVHDRRQVWIIYLVTAAHSTLAQFFIAAEAALIPAVVPAEQLLAANALNGQNRDVARLAGAALGGATAAAGGLTLLAVVDALSFALAAAILLGVRRRDRPGTGTAHRHPVRDWIDGTRTVLRSATLRTIMVILLVTGVGEGILGTLLAAFVRDVLHGGPQAYGLILAVQAAGGIAGGFIAAAVGHRFRPRRLLGWATLCFGALDLALFLYPLVLPRLWPAFVIMVAVGLPAAFSSAALLTIVQTATADAYRGRVMGASTAAQGAAMLAGAVLAGALGGRLGIVGVIAAQGAAYCVAGLIALLFLPSDGGPARPHPTLRPRPTLATLPIDTDRRATEPARTP